LQGSDRDIRGGFCLRAAPAPDAAGRLDAAVGVNLSTSRPSSTLLDATARALPTMVRASPHYYNEEEEIDRALEMIRWHGDQPGPLAL
jgi:selenocysteine lyase/cysteine desulfurase